MHWPLFYQFNLQVLQSLIGVTFLSINVQNKMIFGLSNFIFPFIKSFYNQLLKNLVAFYKTKFN